LSNAVHLLQIITARPGSLQGSGRRRTVLTTLKMAAFAPMPRASVRVAMAANAGFRRRARAPKRMSCRALAKKVVGMASA